MNISEIDNLVDESLAGPSSMYVTHVSDGSQFVEAVRLRFMAKRIDPVARNIVVTSELAERLGIMKGNHLVYFVTDDEPQSVFFDPSLGLFGSAWGPEAAADRYLDLGFRSGDVLEMVAA